MNGSVGDNLQGRQTPNGSNSTIEFIFTPPYAFWSFLGCEVMLIVFGNIMVCWLVFSTRRLRTQQNTFVVSLAVSNMLVGLSIAPCEYCSANRGKLTGIECPMFCGSVISFNMIASIVNLLLIAVDRYLSIQVPFRYYKILTRRRTVILVIIGWVVAIGLVCIPTIWMHKPKMVAYHSNIVYTIVLFSFTIFSGVVLFGIYFVIIRTIRRKIRAAREERPNTSGIKVCVLSVISFFLSWIPYVAVEILVQCEFYFNGLKEMMDATYFILLLNPCLNPVLYAYYRHDFRDALGGWWKRRTELLDPLYCRIIEQIMYTKKKKYDIKEEQSAMITEQTDDPVIGKAENELATSYM